jgi:hypothetical protein
MSARSSIRLAAALGVLMLGASLVACAAPAPSLCPAGFVDTANAAAVDSDLKVTFTAGTVSDVQPAALQSWVQSACIVKFSGELNDGTADGTFSFVTTAIEGEAFALAVDQLGYTGDAGSWTKQDAATPNEAEVITASKPSTDGTSIIDLSTAFPEAQYVISSFHFTAP